LAIRSKVFFKATYHSEDIDKKAKAKGIKMVPTNLVGGGKNSNYDKFEIGEKEHLVRGCPSGHKPIDTEPPPFYWTPS